MLGPQDFQDPATTLVTFSQDFSPILHINFTVSFMVPITGMINNKINVSGNKSAHTLASSPGPLGFERAWCAKIRHVTSLSTSVGVSMETPPFTMTSLQSAYGQVLARCEYSSSDTDGRIASSMIVLYS